MTVSSFINKIVKFVRSTVGRCAVNAVNALSLLLLFCHGQSACYSTRTAIKFKNADDAALTVMKTDGTNALVLPPIDFPQSVSVPASRELTAIREKNGIRLICPACSSGNYIVLANGQYTSIDGLASEIIPFPIVDSGDINDSLVQVPIIYTISDKKERVSSSMSIKRSEYYTFMLVTPWANVEEVKQVDTPMRAIGGVFLGLGSLFALVGVGSFYISSHTDSHSEGSNVIRYMMGVPFSVAGGAGIITGIVHYLLPEDETVYYQTQNKGCK